MLTLLALIKIYLLLTSTLALIILHASLTFKLLNMCFVVVILKYKMNLKPIVAINRTKLKNENNPKTNKH